MNRNKRKEINLPISISTLVTILTAIIVTIGGYIITSKQTKESTNKNASPQNTESQQLSKSNQEIITNDKNFDDNSKIKTTTNSFDNNEKEKVNQIVKQPINPASQNKENVTNKENVITNKIINLAKQRNLPITKLSFSIINLSSYSCPQIQQGKSACYISYQDRKPFYPASIVKLFWMVFAYQKNPNPNEEFKKQLQKMIIDSDNDASSMVVDTITNTKSSKEKLSNQEFQKWKSQRDDLNNYFYSRGFQNINISQKTFPIPYLNMEMPEGADLQLRHPNGEEKPFRNKLSSYDIALLLYQIYGQQYNGSNEMLSLLKRDLNPSAWQDFPYNSIEGFLGQGIPDKNAQFYSKMGWTFSGRNDSAIIISPDQKARYIFVILGDDSAFYEDKTFYPEVSKLVYEEMIK